MTARIGIEREGRVVEQSKFCVVSQENEAKKARAIKKIDDERELTELKDREIERYLRALLTYLLT